MPGDQEEGSDLGRGARSVAQADPQVPRGGDRVGVERHPPRRGERLFDRDGGNNGRPQGHHGAELALGDEPHRRRAEPQAQQAIEGRGAAAALQVTEHQRARLLAGQLRDRVRHLVTDPAEALVLRIDERHRPALGRRALRHDDDAEMAALLLTPADLVAYLRDVERDLGDEDDVGRARDSRVQRDPPGVAAHHFDHHHALVALGGRVELVDYFGGRLDGGVEAERRDGPAYVVVDRLGNADHGNALPLELLRNAQRPVAANRDQGVESQGVKRRDGFVRPIALRPRAVGLLDAEPERVAAVARAEDGPAEMRDAPHRVGVERDDAVLAQESGIAAAHAHALPAAVNGGEHGSADHGIQTGGVAAPRRDGDLQRAAGGATCCISRSTSPGWAWRPCCFLEKILRPSTSTSNTPPEDWISFTSACGYTVRISAARPAARGSSFQTTQYSIVTRMR